MKSAATITLILILIAYSLTPPRTQHAPLPSPPDCDAGMLRPPPDPSGLIDDSGEVQT